MIILLLMLFRSTSQSNNIYSPSTQKYQKYNLTANQQFIYNQSYQLDGEKYSQEQERFYFILDLSAYSKFNISLNLTFKQQPSKTGDFIQIYYYISTFDKQSIQNITSKPIKNYTLSGQLDYVLNNTYVTNYNLLDNFKTNPIIGIKTFSYKQQFSDSKSMISEITIYNDVKPHPQQVHVKQLFIIDQSNMTINNYPVYGIINRDNSYSIKISLPTQMKANLSILTYKSKIQWGSQDNKQSKHINLGQPVKSNSTTNHHYSIKIQSDPNSNQLIYLQFSGQFQKDQVLTLFYEEQQKLKSNKLTMILMILSGVLVLTIILVCLWNKQRKKAKEQLLDDDDEEEDSDSE